MRVALDSRTLVHGRTGIGRNLSGLIQAFGHYAPQVELFLLANQMIDLPTTHTNHHVVVTGRYLPKPLWEHAAMPLLAQRLGVDVCHIPHEGGPLLSGRWRLLVTINDLVPLRFQELYIRSRAHAAYYHAKLETAKRKADTIIAISKATAVDIHELLGVEWDRIRVIPIPVDSCFQPMQDPALSFVLDSLGVRRPYIVAVGSAEPRKNLARILAAYKSVAQAERNPPRLVLFGRNWRNTDSAALVQESGVAGLIDNLGGVSEQELVALYSGADLLVYASLFEGYGLPIQEAMACGCPVVTSNVGAMAEVAGSAALLVTPTDINSIAEGIADMCQDAERRQEFRARGFNHLEPLTWQQVVQATLACYELRG